MRGGRGAAAAGTADFARCTRRGRGIFRDRDCVAPAILHARNANVDRPNGLVAGEFGA